MDSELVVPYLEGYLLLLKKNEVTNVSAAYYLCLPPPSKKPRASVPFAHLSRAVSGRRPRLLRPLLCPHNRRQMARDEFAP